MIFYERGDRSTIIQYIFMCRLHTWFLWNGKKISKTLSLIKNYISLKYQKNVTNMCIHSYDQVSNISKFT
jgi:hypothetical protein